MACVTTKGREQLIKKERKKELLEYNFFQQSKVKDNEVWVIQWYVGVWVQSLMCEAHVNVMQKQK